MYAPRAEMIRNNHAVNAVLVRISKIFCYESPYHHKGMFKQAGVKKASKGRDVRIETMERGKRWTWRLWCL